MNKIGNRLLVGVFTTGAIIILLGFTVFTGGFSSFRNENERFVLVFHENMYGLYEGGKVTLNGVRIGRVERFFLGDAIENAPVPVLVEINRKLVRRHMVENGNKIFDDDGKFKKEIVPTLVGQLIQESFVTGILYVNLTTEDIINGNEVSVPQEIYGYTSLRTKDSIFAELSESINFDKLSKQLSRIIDVATERLDNFDIIGVQSDFTFQISDTMRDVSLMSKSLKRLADLLERNPQAFLIGKPSNSEK